MLRFLPFYACFLTMLCAPLEFARAQEAAVLGEQTEKIERSCLRLSEARRREIQERIPSEEPSVQERTDLIEAARNGLLSRECAEAVNLIFGLVETPVGAYYAQRATRGLLRRGNHYSTTEAWRESRIVQRITVGTTVLDTEQQLLRVPGLTDSESETIRNRFFARSRGTVVERVMLGGLRSPLAAIRSTESLYPLGSVVEVEVNNASVRAVAGASGELPDYVREALRNLSAAEVAEFNASGPQSEFWRRSVSPIPDTQASRFFRGVADAFKPESDRLVHERTLANPALLDAYEAGLRFVENKGQFRIQLHHEVERISVELREISRVDGPRILQSAVGNRRVTGNVGPGRIHYRVLTSAGILLLFTHGLNNIFVSFNNINELNRDGAGGYSSAPYLRNYDNSVQRWTNRYSIGGNIEVIDSMIGLRPDQRPPAQETAR